MICFTFNNYNVLNIGVSFQYTSIYTESYSEITVMKNTVLFIAFSQYLTNKRTRQKLVTTLF